MPRLSLWREDKGNDYHFIDGVIKEQFFVGGTGILIHKYLGPQETGPSDDPSQPNNQASGTTNETSIQDILFLENRDRKYDPDIYELRGHYNVNDNDFDLTQFGLFLSNDTIYLTFLHFYLVLLLPFQCAKYIYLINLRILQRGKNIFQSINQRRRKWKWNNENVK